MPNFRQHNIQVCRFIAALVLIVSIAAAAHAIETGKSQHDNRHCSVCASLHYCALGLVGAPVIVPTPPVKVRPAQILDQQTQKSPTIFHFGARAPPLS